MNSPNILITLADNIAMFVYHLRRRKSPELPYDLYDTYNEWAYSTGTILHDANSVVQVCQLMSILFRVPMPMLVAAIQFDNLDVGQSNLE